LPPSQFLSWCTLHHNIIHSRYNILYARTRVYIMCVRSMYRHLYTRYTSVNHLVQANKRVRYHNMSSVFVAFGDAQPFVRRAWAECLCVVSLRAAYILYIYIRIAVSPREIRLGLFLPKRTCFRRDGFSLYIYNIYIYISYTLYTPHCTRIITPLKRPKHIII